MELNLADICDALGSASPDRECLVFRDRRFTWAQVLDRTRRLARLLADAGLGTHGTFGEVEPWESVHDHLALYLHNGNEYLEGMLGAYQARLAPVNVNYRYRATELAYVLRDSGARAVVYHAAFAPLLDEVRADLPHLELLLQVDDGSGHALLDGALDYEAALAASSPELAPDLVASRSGDDLYVCYTGGTTGMPKGVLWRQADFLVAALGIRRRDGADVESLDELVAAARGSKLRALPAPPLMHGAAHWNAISCWVAGGTVIIQDHPEHFDPDDVLDTAEREAATSLLIVGDPFARPLLDALARRPRRLPHLRHVLSGGAVLSPHTKAELLAALPGTTVVDVLGSSESGRQGVSSVATTAETSAGFAPSTTAVVLADDRRRRLAPGDGEIGWLAQSGRVPLGYLHDRAKSEATFPVVDGVRFAVAGDRARVSADGTIELLGRDSVCINTGGEKVFAEEVETVLKEHPAVLDAVVCGRPSERWGQEVVAVVALRPEVADTVDDAELVARCKDRLASFKAPKAVLRVDAVRRSPAGKADYRWATELATAAAGD